MSKVRKKISLVILLACAVYFVFYIREHFSEFSNIREISFQYVALIGFAYLVCIIVNGLFLKVLIAGFGIDLPFLEYFSISVLTSFGNIFLPMKGGLGFRAVYLKTHYNFDYSYFLASLAGNYLVVFNVSSLTAFAGMLVYRANAGYINIPAAAVFVAIAVCTSWVIFFPPRALDWIPLRWPREQANQVLAGWQMVRKSGGTVSRLFALTLLNVAVTSSITWLEFAAFGMKDVHGGAIGFSQSVVFTAIGSLALFVGITPAALGIRESLLMFCSEILGISPTQAIAVSLLDRTVSMAVLAFLFIFASICIKKQLRTGVPVV